MVHHSKGQSKQSAIRVRRSSLFIRNTLLVNEATVHMKNGSYNKAIFLYNQVSFKFIVKKAYKLKILCWVGKSTQNLHRIIIRPKSCLKMTYFPWLDNFLNIFYDLSLINWNKLNILRWIYGTNIYIYK